MSLLMKALEKAAKDREDADAGREAAGDAPPPLSIITSLLVNGFLSIR